MRSSRLVVQAVDDSFTGKQAYRRKKRPAANALSYNLCFSANEKHFLANYRAAKITALQFSALANDWIAQSQLAPAGFATLIYRDRLDEINTPRHLPTAQPRPTMREQFPLA